MTGRWRVNYLSISDAAIGEGAYSTGCLLHSPFTGLFFMKVFLFSLYYARLLIGVAFGVHQTIHPMSVKWRWQHWPLRDANGQPQPFWRTK
jgi:hypothetical protein